MAECILMKAGGGTGSDECTATKGNVLAGKTAVTSDSNDEAVAGTMPNKGAWTSRIGVNGKAVIPAGYHNGAGYVDQAITNRGAWTGRIGINGKLTIPEGFHNGSGYIDQAIAKYTGTPKAINNVRIANNRFEVAVDAGYYDCYWNGNSYEYMSFAQVASALGLTAAKIKKGETVCGVVGTWEGYVANPTDIYNNGATYFGVGTTGEGRMESNSILLGMTYSNTWVYTTSSINLTGYTGIAVEVMNGDNAGINTKGGLHIFRGSSANGRGYSMGYYGDLNLGNKGNKVIHYLPFDGNHNITDTVGVGYSIQTGSYNTYFYRIWLYK